MAKYEPATVVSLENFGAFVDIGGAEGLIHVTELAWGHVTHPRQLLKVGEEVEVEVISIDPEQNRIGLSMKRVAPDPWDSIATSYRRGQLVKGEITKLAKFGAFAQLIDAPLVEGLIHISELSDQRVQHPREMVQKGDKLTLRVVKIDVKNRRLGLSLKAVNSAEYLDLDWEMALNDDSLTITSDPPAEEEAANAEAPAEMAAEAVDSVEEMTPEAEATESNDEPVAEVVAEEPVAEVEEATSEEVVEDSGDDSGDNDAPEAEEATEEEPSESVEEEALKPKRATTTNPSTSTKI